MTFSDDGGPPPPDGVDAPITDVNTLPIVDDATAARIKAAAGIPPPAGPAVATDALASRATAPGVERWPVKTGQDDDHAEVGKNVINGEDLGAGIVVATVEELVSAPRPADMTDVRSPNPTYQAKRENPVETTIWQLDVTIIAMKSESDGDYHLVLQGATGETMIGEVPTPTTEFVGDSPWLANITAARQAIDDMFVSRLRFDQFAVWRGKLAPAEAFSGPVREAGPQSNAAMGFRTQLPPTRARITGVGFFDTVHGQTGVSQSNGIELHPILKIEWL
jgi:hypothetical protein